MNCHLGWGDHVFGVPATIDRGADALCDVNDMEVGILLF